MSIKDNKHAENPTNYGVKNKLGFVKDGAFKLPPGFRFQPTDQEIVFQYCFVRSLRARYLLRSFPKSSTFANSILGTCQESGSKKDTSLAKKRLSTDMGIE
ncbi:hypothetical protein SSX86_007924 [Deinandra increscens subsp. villosa]|uniref:NAC domain-containing protein n=1 Tax=Deinandra increscens subsp. villosa TaxID=3103831 RepID=A0AAP0DEC5_9ASTR